MHHPTDKDTAVHNAIVKLRADGMYPRFGRPRNTKPRDDRSIRQIVELQQNIFNNNNKIIIIIMKSVLLYA